MPSIFQDRKLRKHGPASLSLSLCGRKPTANDDLQSETELLFLDPRYDAREGQQGGDKDGPELHV